MTALEVRFTLLGHKGICDYGNDYVYVYDYDYDYDYDYAYGNDYDNDND